jgi:hypothetical protein
VGGVDEHVDPLRRQVVREPGGAPEPAAAHPARRPRGQVDPAGERRHDIGARAGVQRCRQHPGLAGAAEDEDAHQIRV